MHVEIIAEIGQNHNGDMDLAGELIREARASGADVAKFQVYDARTLFPREGNPWYEYNCRTELSRGQVEQLAAMCASEDIEFMASVFDVDRVRWLEDIGVRRYKIASRSIYDSDLVTAIAMTGKPMLVSLGMWEEEHFPQFDTHAPVSFLYCVSMYPTALEELHFAEIDFDRYAGFSDHTIGITAAQVAMARGASIVEKHFTLDKAMYGPDHAGSMTPKELRALDEFRTELKACL